MFLQTAILMLHITVAVLLIALVMLQRGKGAEAGAAFGAGASGTVFGAKGSSNFLSHSTAVLAAAFFLTSLSLAYFSSQTIEPDSVIDVPALIEDSISVSPTDDAVQPLDIIADEVSDIPVLEGSDETIVIDEEGDEN